MPGTKSRELNHDSAEMVKALLAAEVLLDPATAPAVIAESQREEVRAFVAAHPLATVAEVSAELVLPEWSIEVRLAELAGRPTPYRKRAPEPKPQESL